MRQMHIKNYINYRLEELSDKKNTIEGILCTSSLHKSVLTIYWNLFMSGFDSRNDV